MFQQCRCIFLSVFVLLTVTGGVAPAQAASPPPPTPGVKCAPGSRPERMQGRVPAADYKSGRAALGYTCNATQIAHIGETGGYRVFRYVDSQNHVCAFYDSTLLFPLNLFTDPANTGVWVLDMTNPKRPVHVTTLRSPAMQTPHESLSLNAKRGLLGAVSANPYFYPGQVDLYDVRTDCRAPTLLSSLPVGVLGHESSFSPDGNTYWTSGLQAKAVAAIDVTNPRTPVTIWADRGTWRVHGMNFSADGRILYSAETERDGLDVFDVSQVQARTPNPTVRQIAHISWPEVSTPQTNIPITIRGHPYLVEIDEFGAGSDPGPVGAARIIDVANPRKPRVISRMRLAVNNKPADPALLADPGADSTVQGYAGHYCAVPSTKDPGVVACSFILSGLRVFDISNPRKPREIAYFNKPEVDPLYSGAEPRGAHAMSQPAFDVKRGHVWYTDGNSGFYVVRINSPHWPRRAG